MEEFIQIIIDNLTNVSIGLFLFLCAYLANMCLGIYYNTKFLQQEFDWKRILNSAIKVTAVGVGIALLTIAITLIIPFADANGLTIPEEYGEVIQVLVILSTCLSATLKYVVEATIKLRNILNQNKEEEKSE